MKEKIGKSQIRFGTDGWRAKIADEFTFDNVRKVAQAIADYIKSSQLAVDSSRPKAKKNPRKRVIVGYDRRFLSKEYARILSEVLAANNIKVLLTKEAAPTPAIAFAIKKRALDGGIIITASHNPPIFNGIKFKTHLAGPADELTTENIERLVGRNRVRSKDFDSAIRDNTIEFTDISDDYIRFLRKYVNIDKIRKAKPKILIDYMHGAGAGYIEAVLGKGISSIDIIRDQIDPMFGGVNPEPIPKNLGASLKHIKTKKFDIGVAIDGDGDRIGALRPDAKFITSGQIISLILLHFLEFKKLTGNVVKTISGTTLIERICKRFDLKLLEVPVGFKHISHFMLKENVLIGGEESGGIGFCNYMPERDGILSALLLIEMIAERKKTIISIMNDIDKRFGKFCYDRLDIAYPKRKARLLTESLKKNPPLKIAGEKVQRMKTYDGIKFILEDASWLLLRFSGTEPLIRIYAEGPTEEFVKRLLKEGKRIIFDSY
ncbi:MAG: phosphoglucomutase/phosphomannomutase family protein [Candidatus Omnitrophota bacterium]